jgi:hypothetical protein
LVTAKKKREAVTPPEIIEELLETAGEDLVLVGGQALAFWCEHFAIASAPSQLAAITNDVDFLSKSAADTHAVRKLAKALAGTAHFPSEAALTALVGQAMRDISDEEFLNVDVIFKVFGLDAATVRKRAVRIVPPGGAPFFVMHELDVLASRLANLYKLKEKQNAKGKMQLALSIDVARAFLREEARKAKPSETAEGRSLVQHYVSQIEKLAMDDAGRKVAARYDVHVADAIDPLLVPPGLFWEKRWPVLRELMSASYRETITPPSRRK